jgi:hypothetical protein
MKTNDPTAFLHTFHCSATALSLLEMPSCMRFFLVYVDIGFLTLSKWILLQSVGSTRVKPPGGKVLPKVLR